MLFSIWHLGSENGLKETMLKSSIESIKPELTFRSKPLRKTGCPEQNWLDILIHTHTQSRSGDHFRAWSLTAILTSPFHGISNGTLEVCESCLKNGPLSPRPTTAHQRAHSPVLTTATTASKGHSSALSPLSCGTGTEKCCLASVPEHAGTAAHPFTFRGEEEVNYNGARGWTLPSGVG